MIQEQNLLKYFFSSASGRISKGIKNEFELAMVNEPSVFELLRFVCSSTRMEVQVFACREKSADGILKYFLFSQKIIFIFHADANPGDNLQEMSNTIF